MSETSNQYAKQNTKQCKSNRGGDKKVMKKSLSLIVASAMAFSAFASAAFADEKALDAQGKFDALKAAGILSGYPDGSAGLANNMTRAEFAKVVALLAGLDQDASAASYSDVAAGHWAKGFIGAVTKAKLMSGAYGKFDPKGNVTVEQIAKVADLVAGLKPEGEVAGETSAWAEGYVAAAVKAGLIDEMSSYKENAKREVLVNVAYDLAQSLVTVKDSKVVDSKNVEVTFTDGQTEKVALDTALEANKETAIKVKHNGKEFEVKVTYKVDAVTVQSASASNLKEIVVSFDGAVDKTSAETAANYTVKVAGTTLGGGAFTPALNADTKSVTLTLTAAAANQSAIEVTVANVKDTANRTIATKTVTTSAFDVAPPKATSAVMVAPDKLEVTFSEPIKTNGTYKLNNGTYSVSVASTVGNKVTLNVPTLADGSYTLNITDATDFADLKSGSQDVTVSYTKDASAPTATLDSAKQNEVKIVFNKAISAATQGSVVVYHTYNGNASFDADSYAWSADGKTLTATFNSIYLPLGSATIFVKAGDETNVKDVWGNVLKSAVLTATITADTTAPTVTGVSFVDSTHVDVTFSEAVAGAATTGNYSLKDANGNVIAVSAAAQQGSTNTYRLTTAVMNGGSFTLAIAKDAIKDTSLGQNGIAAYSSTFVAPDKVAPTANSAVTDKGDGTATKIKVTFSEAMATSGTGSVLDKGAYLLNSAALPSDATIAAADNGSAVIITLPAQLLDNASLVVGRVADAAGNFTSTLSTSLTVHADQVTSAAIINAKTVDAKTVTFEVKTPISAIDVSKFTVNGVAAASASFSNTKVDSGKTDGALVTLTVLDASKWAANTMPQILATAGAFTSAFGTASTAIVPGDNLTAADGTAPALASAKVTGPTTLVLTYNEPIKATSVSLYSYTVANNSVTAVNVAGSAVTLTLGTAITGSTPSASYTQAQQIEDANGNKLAAQTAATATDGVAANVTGDFTNADTKIVTINFDEAMDASTLVQGNFSSAAGGVITNFVKAGDNKSVTITFTTGLVATNSVVVAAAVKDAAGNASGATVTK
jgi:hypothetical protein